MAQREQKVVNVYGEGTIQTVEAALELARGCEDVQSNGDALAKLAFVYILDDEEREREDDFDSQTLQNGITAAMQEPGVRTVEDALQELAEAYTGKYLD